VALRIYGRLQHLNLTKIVFRGEGGLYCDGKFFGVFLETLPSADKLLGHVCSLEKIFKILETQPYLAGQVTLTEGVQLWLLKTVPILKNHQDAKRDESISSN